jgi:glycerol-3-phosphate acyltransferase PlsX
MGSVYCREVLKHKNPRVGILSNGTEDNKGNELTLEAFRLCKKLNLNFIGNIEGHDLFKGHVDVVVCDGFIGNIVLKSVESLAVAMFSMLRRELLHSAQRKLGAYLAKGAFQSIRRRMDPEVYGGAPMLGFNGVVFKAHASARDRAVTSAIRMTVHALKNQINQTIARDIAAANKILDAEKDASAN